jgi:hypothetical protein
MCMSYLGVYSHIWLNVPRDDHHIGYNKKEFPRKKHCLEKYLLISPTLKHALKETFYSFLPSL